MPSQLSGNEGKSEPVSKKSSKQISEKFVRYWLKKKGGLADTQVHRQGLVHATKAYWAFTRNKISINRINAVHPAVVLTRVI